MPCRGHLARVITWHGYLAHEQNTVAADDFSFLHLDLGSLATPYIVPLEYGNLNVFTMSCFTSRTIRRAQAAAPPPRPPRRPHSRSTALPLLVRHVALSAVLASALAATACLAHWSRTTDRQIARQHRDGVRARLLAQSGLAYAQTLLNHYLEQKHTQSHWQDVVLPTASDTFKAFARCTQRLLDNSLILDGQKTTTTKRTLTVPHVTVDGGRSDTFTIVFQRCPDNPARIRVYSLASCHAAARHLSRTFTIQRASPPHDSQLVRPQNPPPAYLPTPHISSASQPDASNLLAFSFSIWGTHCSSQPGKEKTNQPGAAC